VPYRAVACTSAFGLLAFLNLDTSGGLVFNWLLNITAVAGLITWACLNWCHLRFIAALKAQNINRATLPYTAPWQPWLTWYGLGFNMLILFTQGFTSFIPWDVKGFFAAYISLILFIVLFVGHKWVMRTKVINPAKADLDSGRLEVEDMVWDEKSPTTLWGKALAWIE
jgi:amino acid transporter